MMIPVSSCLLQGNEKKYLCQAIDEGEVSSKGRFVREFEAAFARWSGNRYVVAVNSGTAALETAIWAAHVQEEIWIPTGTIVSCLVAAHRNNVKINLYDEAIKEKNVLRCHLFGKFNDKAFGSGRMIEDCAQYWKPFKVRDVAAYSLYANKLITAGEGGVVVTNKRKAYARACLYRDLHHSPQRFIHHALGYNFRMTNMQAAVALAQLEQIGRFTEIKQKNRDLYKDYLPAEAEILFDVEVPWMYLIKTKRHADDMVGWLADKGIDCRRYFCPMHWQPFFTKMHGKTPMYRMAEDLWQHAFYLPSGPNLTERDIIYVCSELCRILRPV